MTSYELRCWLCVVRKSVTISELSNPLYCYKKIDYVLETTKRCYKMAFQRFEFCFPPTGATSVHARLDTPRTTSTNSDAFQNVFRHASTVSVPAPTSVSAMPATSKTARSRTARNALKHSDRVISKFFCDSRSVDRELFN